MASTAFQSVTQRLDQRNPSAAVEMVALAQAGDADAQHKASELTLRGMAGPVDLKQANRWMANAAAPHQLKDGVLPPPCFISTTPMKVVRPTFRNSESRSAAGLATC